MDADNESVEGETGSCPPEPFLMSNFVSNLIQLGTRPSDPRGAWASLSQYVTGEQWIPAYERNNTVHPTSHSNAAVNQSICYNARSSNTTSRPNEVHQPKSTGNPVPTNATAAPAAPSLTTTTSLLSPILQNPLLIHPTISHADDHVNTSNSFATEDMHMESSVKSSSSLRHSAVPPSTKEETTSASVPILRSTEGVDHFYSHYVDPNLSGTDADNIHPDVYAWNNPKSYPNGGISYEYCVKSEDSKPPQINWAKETKRSTKNKFRWKCLGIYKCGDPQCQHRSRPQVPRRGSGKYSSSGKIPPIKDKERCTVHEDIQPVYMPCSCVWKMKKNETVNGETRWMVDHEGEHCHPAPFPIHLSEKGRKHLIDILKVDPNLRPIELAKGNELRPKASDIDIRLGCQDFLAYATKKQREDLPCCDHGSQLICSNL